MKTGIITVSLISSLGLGVTLAWGSLPNLDVKSRYVQSSEPMTTEKVWVLDPGEVNPHRQRWVIQRRVELRGLKAVSTGKGRFGVSADGIDSLLTSLIRPASS